MFVQVTFSLLLFVHSPCTGMLTCFLFSHQRQLLLLPLFDLLGLALRSTHSMLTAIALKPFLTLVVKQRSHLTTCYSHQDLYWCTIHTGSLLVCFQSLRASHLPTRWISFFSPSLHLLFICLYTFSAIHFQGYCICPVSCYTLLSRFQLPWPLSGCPNATTLFDGI